MEIDFNTKHWDNGACPKVDCRKNSCKCGLEKVFLSAALGDDSKDSPIAPKNGAYCNAIVVYEANNHVYIYSKEGIPTLVETGGDVEEIIEQLENQLAQEVLDRQAADNTLQGEIDDLKNSPDVVDIVATYAALQAYDTSHLGDNDIIRVLQDEQHDGQSTYYRWNKQSSTWTYIGAVGDYYTKGQVDTLLADKQNTLTAGANVAITQVDDDLVISATDTTYSAFVGTDGVDPGTAGLVPAPATTDAGKFLKADGTWDTAGGGGPTVVQTTGSSTTDVMSQKAVTDELYPQYSAHTKGVIGIGNYSSIADYGDNKIGIGNVNLGASSAYALAINGGDSTGTVNAISAMGIWAGRGGSVTGHSGIAIGNDASVSSAGGVAIGANSSSTQQGEFNIGTSNTSRGYNSTNYRLISGVHDGQTAHDAATKGQLDSIALKNAGAPTTSTVGTVGQLLEDTTNGKLYQCTAVDTTDPNNPSYTWTEIGAGGGGPTVVQATGTSQTDVMSQNATASMIFADPGTDTKIKIGASTTLNSNNSIVIGSGAEASGSNSYRSVVIGPSATSSKQDAVALGPSASVSGIGTGSGDFGVAIGRSANCSKKGAVALGSYSSVSSVGEVNIGSSDTSHGYSSTNYRLLTGVHDPVNAHDAATKGYVDTNTAAIGTLANLTTTAKTDLVAAVNEVDTIANGIVDNFDFNQGVTCTVTSSNVTISSGSTTLTSFANDTGSIGKIYGRVKGTTSASDVTITFDSQLRPASSINIDGFCLAYHPESSTNTKAIIKMPSITIGTDGTCTVTVSSVAIGVEINFYFFAGLIFAKNLGDSIVTN